MPLRDDYQQWYTKQFAGMNNKLEENELNVTVGVLAQNVRYEDEPGSAVKRAALTYFNGTTLGSTAPVHSVYRFYTSDGTAKLLVAWSTKFYVGNDTTGVFTEIRSGLTTGKKFTFVTYKDLAYCSNGYDNIFLYDNSSDNLTWEMGACKAKLTAGGSNLDSGAAYYYAVTMDNDAYVCGAVSNTVTTDAGNRKITLSNIPLGPTGIANRKIYRTEGGGAALKLLTTIADNTTTTYVDDIADGSLTDAYPAVTDDVPKGNLIKIYRERLFISGDPNYPSRIYYSNAYLPHYIQQTTNTDYMSVSENDNDEIMGIPIVQSIMHVFKRNTIRKVHITTPVGGASPTQWYAEDPLVYHGAVSKWAIVETPYGIIYPGTDHWKLFNGSNIEDVFDEFDTSEVLQTRYAEMVAHFQNNIFYCAYTDASTGSMINDRLMLYSMIRKAMSFDVVNVDCFASEEGSDETGDIYYGSSKEGYVYLGEDALLDVIYKTKSQLSYGITATDAIVDGTEDDPYLRLGRTETIDALAGTIDALVGTIDQGTTTGNIIFPSLEIGAGSFGLLYWNERFYGASDDVQFYTRTGATQAACEAAAWAGPVTNPNGSTIPSTANVWIQIKIVFTSTDYTNSPRVYKSDNFVFKFQYSKGGATAETSVEFRWRMGFRNFDTPMIDKVFKKIITNHEGEGSFTVKWETEHADGEFIINTSQYPEKWDSYFPSTAFGRKIDIEIYKNDLYDFKIKEIMGIYSPRPILI